MKREKRNKKFEMKIGKMKEGGRRKEEEEKLREEGEKGN